MLKKYATWLYFAAAIQTVLGTIQFFFLFKKPVPLSDAEERLFAMMATVPVDPGGGVNRTFDQLHLAAEACLVILCLYSAVTSVFLVWKKIDVAVMRGVIGIKTIVFGVLFVVMACLTFMPLIVLTGLIFVLTLIAFFTCTRAAKPT